jgi:16S rRNA (cytosine967-C5)-methyltransferase
LISPARQTAFDILLRIETQQAYASELLHSDRTAMLSPADCGLCMELVMGVLRWRSRLDSQIALFSFTPFRKLDLEVLTALRIGIYQLEFLHRVPARAAINESVDLVKLSRKTSAAPLTNAILRKIPKTTNEVREQRRQGNLMTPSVNAAPITGESLASGFAHPQWLVERWIQNYGGERAEAICRHDQCLPTAALRLREASAEEELRKSGIELTPGAMMRGARRVASGDPSHTFACHEGRIAIQDEASQLVAALVGTGARILDCCAAPGGKTSAIADRNPQSEIIAAELHEHRAELMRRLVSAPHVSIIVADARALPESGQFDRVLVDVPCSGTGTLARNPDIKWRLKAEDLSGLQESQSAILGAALQHLAPGGRLIYSSCSLEPEENEAVIERVLAQKSGTVRLIDCRDELSRLQRSEELAWPEMESLLRGQFLRTIPGVHPCDGFFAAVLEKL